MDMAEHKLGLLIPLGVKLIATLLPASARSLWTSIKINAVTNKMNKFISSS
jgi:hypothetical protein